MNTSKKYIGVFLLVLFLISGCQKYLLKEVQFNAGRTAWCWGGSSSRRGKSSEEIGPPLKLIWTYKASSAVGKSIVAADSFLFFGMKAGGVTILNLHTGKPVKKIKTRKVEVTCSLNGKRLVLARRWGKPSLRSINLFTGKTIWRKNSGSISGEPLVVEGRLVLGNEAGEIFCLDSGIGKIFWKKNIGGHLRGSLASSGNNIFAAAEEGTVWSLSLKDGRTNWKRKIQNGIFATPVLDSGKLFVGTTEGTFYALSMRDGSVVWKFKPEGKVYETAAVAEGFVYFGTTQGILYCLYTESGKEKWSFNTGSVVSTSPLISGRWLYFGTLDRMFYGILRENGEEKWSFKTKGRIRSSPLIWRGTLIIASEDRFVYGFIEKK